MNNRIIKYRAWDKHNKHWCDTKYTRLSLDGLRFDYFRPEDKGRDNGLFIGGSLTNNYVLQQFTGLLDKNGKDIYEGDILKLRGEVNCVASWIGAERGQQYSYAYALTIPNTPYREDFQFFTSSDVELVGNIYENPELIKQV